MNIQQEILEQNPKTTVPLSMSLRIVLVVK